MENTKMNEETSDKKKRRALWLLLVLLLGLGWMLFSAMSRPFQDSTLISISFRENPVKVSSFDNEQTRAKALINNIVITQNGVAMTIDASKAKIVDGALSYDDGELAILVTNAMSGGQADVTVIYQGQTATASFIIIVISPEPGKKGNVIEAPAVVSEVREINIVTSETPKTENSENAVEKTEDSVVVNPEDVATPIHEPEPTSVPEVKFNKVSIAFEDGTKLSLFAEGEGNKLVILFKDGQYINYASGNRVEFTVSEDVQGVAFEMKEYDADNNIISTSDAIFTK